MASPERIRKNRVLIPISVAVSREPAINTMNQEKNNTIVVRRAVAISESVFFMPHFARTAVRPAKRAEKTAIMIHIDSSFPADQGDCVKIRSACVCVILLQFIILSRTRDILFLASSMLASGE